MKTEKHIIKGHFKGKRPHVKVTAYELSTVDCSADKMSGYYSQEATLISDDPEPGYDFAGWSVTGSNVTGNNVRFEGDITAKANYSAHVYNVALQNDGHGTIAADKTTGIIGDTITLSNTPATHYHFSGYSLTGATLTSNQFNIETNDVTAKGWFAEDPKYNLTLQNDGHGSIGAGKTTGYQGDTTTLSNTANNGYVFSAYSVTGATLNGSTLTFGAQDATAKVWFRTNSAVLVNKGSREYMKSGSPTGTVVVSLGIPTTANYKFLTYIFDLKPVGEKKLDNETLGFYSNRLYSEIFGIKCFQSKYAGSPGATNFVSANITGLYTGTANIPGSTAVATAYRWLNMNGSGYFNRFKYVFDRNNKKQYIFINNTYLGYSNLSTDPLSITSIKVEHNSTGYKTGPYLVLKNLSVAGTNDLTAASSYNG